MILWPMTGSPDTNLEIRLTCGHSEFRYSPWIAPGVRLVLHEARVCVECWKEDPPPGLLWSGGPE